jgi:hypothetical protein
LLRQRLDVLSCPPIQTVTYPIKPGRLYPSLLIGSMLSEDSLHPFGLGLTHPGWPQLRARGEPPILLENLKDAEKVRRAIMRLAVHARQTSARTADGARPAPIDLRPTAL